MAIKTFKNRATEDINYGKTTKEALKILPRELHHQAKIKLARLGAITELRDLTELKGNRFEKLKGKRKGQFSIRINKQYKICFRLERNNVFEVKIVDYH